jgi:hypothetical protein
MVDQILAGVATGAILYMAQAVRSAAKKASAAFTVWTSSVGRCDGTSRRLEALVGRLEDALASPQRSS